MDRSIRFVEVAPRDGFQNWPDPVSTDIKERLVRDLGDSDVMVLKHHGLLTTGRTVGEAFYNMYYLEQACRLQVFGRYSEHETMGCPAVADLREPAEGG